MKAYLVPTNGDSTIVIDRDVTVIGRRPYCDLQIDHEGLSRRHCVIVRTDGLLVVRDLVSTNGTKVNGQRIQMAALLSNDRISLGGYRLQVQLDDSSYGQESGGGWDFPNQSILEEEFELSSEVDSDPGPGPNLAKAPATRLGEEKILESDEVGLVDEEEGWELDSGTSR